MGEGAGTVTASRLPRGGKSEKESGEHEKHGAPKAAVRVALATSTTGEHDYSTGNIVDQFLKFCYDPLHDLQGWLDLQEPKRGAGHRLFAQPRTGLAGNGGLQQVLSRGRTPGIKLFRHAAKIATACTGDFNRSLMPFLSRVARAVIRDAAQQTTQHPQAEPEPCSYEAEIAAIVGRYGAAIEAVRRLNMPRHEIEAIIRGLREQQSNEISGVQKRRKAKAAERPPKP